MSARQTERKVNAIIDEILDEDRENDFGATQTETYPGGREKLDDTPEESPRQCRCGVENSSRFSLRVMEAMRSLQRDVDQSSTSTAEEIANYIRSYYRHDGDLYAQVRTALRQVCSQGFVMELLSNEYHLVGPVVSPAKRNGCSWDCKGRTTDDASRRRKSIDDQRNGVCGCARFPRRSPRQGPRSPREESLRTAVPLEDSEPIFHSTGISAVESDNADRRDREFNADVSDIRDDRDTIVMEQRDNYAEPIPGPSRSFLETPSTAPARNAKETREEDRGVHRADEKDDDTTTEEDMDCTCDAEVVTRDEHSRIRPLDRPRVDVRNQRNGRRRNNVEEDEEDEERMMEENEERRMEGDEEDEGGRTEEDESTEEDSVYEELRARVPRRRNAARERELRRWIRRCRQECERRRGR